MTFSETSKGVIIKGSGSNINFEHTLECGQCFRWKKNEGNKYFGIANKENIIVYKLNSDIIIENTTIENAKKIWASYFDLNFDYGKSQKELENIHPIFKKIYKTCSGIHILKQDPWETLCSFIISQNNNIPRIKKIIESFCVLFGEKIKNTDFYSFPDYEIVSKLSEKDLSHIKCGFRAKYIIDAAKKVSSGEINLDYLSQLKKDKAKEILMKIRGVGPKVSECTLLYAYHKLECFPMDVWMKKIMNTMFKDKNISFFGKYPGIAQQYLYYYFRNNPSYLEI